MLKFLELKKFIPQTAKTHLSPNPKERQLSYTPFSEPVYTLQGTFMLIYLTGLLYLLIRLNNMAFCLVRFIKSPNKF